MTMNNQKKEDDTIIVVKSRKPTEKDEFYLSWGRELIKNEFNLSNELLKQQITLSLGVLAVSFIFDELLKDTICLRNTILSVLFLALISSFIGIMPFKRNDVWIDSPDDIENFKKDALSFKRFFYMASAFFTIFGVGLILVKIIFYS